MSTLAQVDPEALITLLKGEPGVRKSTCALSYPKPQYWISTDQKMYSIVLPAKKWGVNLSQIEYDDYMDFDAPRIKLEAFQTQCRFKAIIVDSLTSVGDNINRQVSKNKGAAAHKIGGIPVDTIEDYKAEASAFREMMALLKDISKYHRIPVVMIAHVVGQRSSNDANKLTHHSRVIVTGGDKIAAKISAYCHEAYHFNIEPAAAESQEGDYTCITAHTGNDYARTCLDLPRKITFNADPLYSKWIRPAIDKMKPTPTTAPTTTVPNMKV